MHHSLSCLWFPGALPCSILDNPIYYISIPPSVRLTLTWSMGRKLALHISIYHSICSKYKCYTANVCNKRNPSLYLNIFIAVQLTSSFPTTCSRLTFWLSWRSSGDQTRSSWVHFPPQSEFFFVLVWPQFHQ